MSIPSVLRLLAAVCLLVGASLAQPSRLAAQVCPLDGCTAIAPTVRVLPEGGTWSDTLETGPFRVTIEWCDDQPLAQNRMQVTFNGQTIPISLDPVHPTWCAQVNGATSTVDVGLSHGTQSLSAQYADDEGLQGHDASAFVYNRLLPPSNAAPPAGQRCFVSVSDAIRVTYLQVREETVVQSAVDYHTARIESGQATLRQLVLALAQSPEYHQRFITGRDAAAVLTDLFRHLLAREPDAGAWPLLDMAAAYGWNHVSAHIVNSGEYTARFGDRAAPGDPVVAWDCGRAGLALDPAVAAPVRERDLCLTISAGSGAAYECGDLRLVHALPTVTTLNKPRTPVLLFNSAHADAQTVVGAYVTLPPGATASSVRAVLTGSAGAVLAQKAWPAWTAGEERRIAIPFDVHSLATGIFPYTLQVTVLSGTSTVATYTATGELGVVNRRGSAFGMGWWLAGLEQVVAQPDGRIFWVGGDGSHRVYRSVAGNSGPWAAVHGTERPDTLYASTFAGARYERRLPGGVVVAFDSLGRHIATINRLNHQTRFQYRLDGRLDSIIVPKKPGHDIVSTIRYGFAYNASGKLNQVTSPDLSGVAGRAVTLSPRADGRVDWIRDPDNRSVLFSYGTGRPWVPETRTDRRNTVTRFTYDGGGKLASSTVEMQGTGDNVRAGFAAQESRGVASPAPADIVHTLYDGPRPGACMPSQPCISPAVDETRFWVDRWGAPQRIRDALGHETTVTRGDVRFRALVTRTRAGNGLETSAEYNARGNVTLSTVHDPLGDGGRANSYYFYTNPAWPDFLTAAETPTGLVLINYGADGSRTWQQVTRDTTRRVEFRYYTSGTFRGMLRAVDGPLSNPDSVWYDASGNLRYTLTGGVGTTYRRDGLGRVYETVTPGRNTTENVTARVWYDVMDRDTMTQTGDPLVQAVKVWKRYDEEGNLLSVARMSLPDSANIRWVVNGWEYDRANRKTVEISPDHDPEFVTGTNPPESLADNPRDVTTYDAAGNPVAVRTRRNREITMQYDAMGRLRSRTVPFVTYPREVLRDSIWPAEVVPGEVATFTYDELGNVKTAHNPSARVTRDYYPGGALRAETQHLATWAGAFDSTLHVYRLEHGYDLAGRRTWTRHPFNIAPRASHSTTALDLTQYGYDPPTGLLTRVTDPMGNVFRYTYDAEGRLDSLINVAGQVVETRVYDGDGRLRSRLERGGPAYVTAYASDVLHQDQMPEYDRRGKLLQVTSGWHQGLPATSEMEYSALGALSVSTDHDPRRSDHMMTIRESYSGDGTGNVYSQGSNQYSGTKKHVYQPGTGRLLGSKLGTSVLEWAVFDSAGNRVWAQWTQFGAQVLSRSLYSSDNRLVAVDRHSCLPGGNACQPATSMVDDNSGVVERYRYDALGRRVLVRAVRDGRCTNDTVCHSTIERTIWDGDQILYEIRMPGSDTLGAGQLERDTTTIIGAAHAPYGRVAYTYGLELDAPLSILRMGYTFASILMGPAPGTYFHDFYGATAVFPHRNWRGAYDIGTFADGLAKQDGMDARCKITTNYYAFCVEVKWPASNTGFFGMQYSAHTSGETWMGSQIDGRRDASGLQYMRNRYYDPQTARFTQEDPIGLGGGLNLYGFAAGDPVSFSDPYGLKVCLAGTTAEVGALHSALEGAIGATISLDENNCVSEIGASSDRSLRKLRDRLISLVRNASTYTVGFTGSREFSGSRCDNLGSHFCHRDEGFVVEIDRWDVRQRTDPAAYFGCSIAGRMGLGPRVSHSGESILAHELLGHAWAHQAGLDVFSERIAIRAENVFRARGGGRQRCGG